MYKRGEPEARLTLPGVRLKIPGARLPGARLKVLPGARLNVPGARLKRKESVTGSYTGVATESSENPA